MKFFGYSEWTNFNHRKKGVDTWHVRVTIQNGWFSPDRVILLNWTIKFKVESDWSSEQVILQVILQVFYSSKSDILKGIREKDFQLLEKRFSNRKDMKMTRLCSKKAFSLSVQQIENTLVKIIAIEKTYIFTHPQK